MIRLGLGPEGEFLACKVGFFVRVWYLPYSWAGIVTVVLVSSGMCTLHCALAFEGTSYLRRLSDLERTQALHSTLSSLPSECLTASSFPGGHTRPETIPVSPIATSVKSILASPPSARSNSTGRIYPKMIGVFCSRNVDDKQGRSEYLESDSRFSYHAVSPNVCRMLVPFLFLAVSACVSVRRFVDHDRSEICLSSVQRAK